MVGLRLREFIIRVGFFGWTGFCRDLFGELYDRDISDGGG